MKELEVFTETISVLVNWKDGVHVPYLHSLFDRVIRISLIYHSVFSVILLVLCVFAFKYLKTQKEKKALAIVFVACMFFFSNHIFGIIEIVFTPEMFIYDYLTRSFK